VSTGEFTRVAATSEIPDGSMKAVDVAGERVVVANEGGSFFAFCEECTHDGGPLSQGELSGGIVTCPWHFSSFDIRTGAVVDSPAEDAIAVFEVKVEDDAVFVGRPRSA
jgi:nitrite reductase/ring-hydroxylating ferredoxin subunit